jgi:hypothetical protein
MEWTGHKDIRSLDVYIDLAFAEVAQMGQTFSVARKKQITESAIGTLKGIKVDCKHGESVADTVDRLTSFVSALAHDLEDSDAGSVLL